MKFVSGVNFQFQMSEGESNFIMSFELLIKKVRWKGSRATLRKAKKVVAILSPASLSDKQFFRALSCKGNRENFAEHIKREEKPAFFFNSKDKERIVELIRKEYRNSTEAAIEDADEICNHIFDLLGSGKVNLGKKIDWHRDFKSSHRWNPRTYCEEIKYGYKPGVDVKVPWELSRFQHLTTLGEAYWLTKKEKYAYEFVDQITDWIEHNPPKFGVNWACTMDVAIRVCNWLLVWEFFKNSPLISDEFIIKFFKSLLQHGRHIKSNLEWSETLTSNHYLSDIVGLVYLGVLIPEFKESKNWKNFAIEELKKEMKKQVYPDGVDFEASTCYHRLVLELFFYATFLVIINDKNFKEDNFMEVGNEIFGEKYLQRLYKMFEFVLYALKPNGRMPQIGDNDGGRLHVFTKREILDLRYLLTLGAIFFKEPKFKINEFGFCEEALWVFGEKGYKIWQDLEENCPANTDSRAFPDAGWYIMRNDRDYMIISCGPNGQNGNGGHCHNDKLSFELCIDGEDIIVDPGTYVYTPEPEWRNKFRSTTYHNTVVVDKKEQNEFNRKSLFEVKNDAEVKCLKWETGNEIDIFVGEHYGYKRFSQPVIHKREIKFYKKERKLEIIDKFTGEGKHNLEWNLILSPEFKQKLNISSDKLQWRRDSAFYSSEYGTITKTEKLTSILRVTIPVELKFWIEI